MGANKQTSAVQQLQNLQQQQMHKQQLLQQQLLQQQMQTQNAASMLGSNKSYYGTQMPRSDSYMTQMQQLQQRGGQWLLMTLTTLFGCRINLFI